MDHCRYYRSKAREYRAMARSDRALVVYYLASARSTLERGESPERVAQCIVSAKIHRDAAVNGCATAESYELWADEDEARLTLGLAKTEPAAASEKKRVA